MTFNTTGKLLNRNLIDFDIKYFIFPKCIAKGSFGGLGVETCSLHAAFVSATVRNCSRPFAKRLLQRCLWPVLARGIMFAGLKPPVTSYCVGNVALRDVAARFVTRRNSICVTGAILLKGLQKMTVIFRGKHSTLDVSMFMLRGRRSPSDVSCSMVFANRICRAASSCDNMQIPWQAAFDVMKIDGNLARK